MQRQVKDYTGIVGNEVVEKIYALAEKIERRNVVHINSTFYGGGVAEILKILIPLLNDAGINAEWKVLNGTPKFFEITKKIHNALQGNKHLRLEDKEKELYMEINRRFSEENPLDYDMIFVHDPQPIAITKYYEKKQPWIWRCHIDLSDPNPQVWKFIKKFVSNYDLAIISNREYVKSDFPIPYRIVYPAIDPLSEKNRDISYEEAEKILERKGIPLDMPYILQVSRFDPWKDPIGVVKIFKKVKEKYPVRLILCGSMAHDDPEGVKVYEEVKEKAKNLIENGDIILCLDAEDITVNALQKMASVIIQKSLREGFGLTVTEAMWKGKPVVASKVGGIKIQIVDGESGFLVDPYNIEGFAEKVLEILKDKSLAEKIGKNARERVRRNFLITRLLEDHLKIMKDLSE